VEATAPSPTPADARAHIQPLAQRVALARASGRAAPRNLAVWVRRRTVLRAAPRRHARVIAHVYRRTGFGSPVLLHVVRRRGAWLSVISPALRNGRTAWMSARGQALVPIHWNIVVSLSHRQVTVRHYGRVFARFPIAIGAPATPTPRGRFSVTDKLRTQDPLSSPYGCCILALSAHQTHIAQGWGGGDRVAIHTTSEPSTIGYAVSHGCMRAPTIPMRRVLSRVPLGTPVRIRE
jgi:hypothetical protein